MTQLHECGKCGSNITKRFLTDYVVHGAGISVENALSSWLELTIWRNKEESSMCFEDGE
uniref:DNA gyrase subunit B, putative n=1 Tax=Brugia malayi TaxID=6279 RepID=A8PBB5_BRUMA